MPIEKNIFAHQALSDLKILCRPFLLTDSLYPPIRGSCDYGLRYLQAIIYISDLNDVCVNRSTDWDSEQETKTLE